MAEIIIIAANVFNKNLDQKHGELQKCNSSRSTYNE